MTDSSGYSMPGHMPEKLTKLHDKNLIWEDEHLRLRHCRYGLMLYPHQDTYVGRSLDVYGEYMESEANLFRHFVKPEDIVLDIGANIGAHTVVFADIVRAGGGTVLAFEPQRYCFTILTANIALNGLHHVKAYYAALGDAVGKIRVPYIVATKNLNLGSCGINLWQGASTGDIVDCYRLDDSNLAQCNFIKLDVEGMELNVLRGAEKLLQRCRPVMFIEDDRKDKSSLLQQFLREQGYRLYRVSTYFHMRDNFFAVDEDVFLQHGADGSAIKTQCINLVCIPNESDMSCPQLESTVVQELGS